MKTLFTIMAILLTHVIASAQESTQTKTFGDDPMMPLYALSVLVVVVAILVLIVALYTIRIVNMMAAQAEKVTAIKDDIAHEAAPSLWYRITQKLNASVPVAKEKDIDTGHEFDGIRELDNHLPPWWKWLFIGTVVWALVYFFVFHISSSLPLSIEEYDTEVAMARQHADELKASQPASVIDENTLVYKADDEILAKGKNVFSSTCVACHRADGGGNTIGPNLTDEFWIHGGGIKNIFLTIKNGKVDKGMPEWGKAMSVEDVRNVAFYVMSLQGSNPANGKAPQGEKVMPEKVAAPVDSTVTRAAL
jgi:cytochrome c oxidase cbb3-type subunit 3